MSTITLNKLKKSDFFDYNGNEVSFEYKKWDVRIKKSGLRWSVVLSFVYEDGEGGTGVNFAKFTKYSLALAKSDIREKVSSLPVTYSQAVKILRSPNAVDVRRVLCGYPEIAPFDSRPDMVHLARRVADVDCISEYEAGNIVNKYTTLELLTAALVSDFYVKNIGPAKVRRLKNEFLGDEIK